MTGIDEHIRTINRAISYVPTHTEGGQDAREAARTALHHIAAREQGTRESLAAYDRLLREAEARVKELEAIHATDMKTWELNQQSIENREARVQELEAEVKDARERATFNASLADERWRQAEEERARVQELEDLLEAERADEREWLKLHNRIRELEVECSIQETRREKVQARARELEAGVSFFQKELSKTQTSLAAARQAVLTEGLRVKELEAELEKAGRCMHNEKRLWELKAENERLREQLKELEAEAKRNGLNALEAWKENERLQKMHRGSGIWSEIDRLKKENERLRGHEGTEHYA